MFRIKTTDPTGFSVQPKIGNLAPGKAVSITIKMKGVSTMPTSARSKEKFQIQSVRASKSVDPNDLWKDSSQIEDFRMRVIFTGPSFTLEELAESRERKDSMEDVTMLANIDTSNLPSEIAKPGLPKLDPDRLMRPRDPKPSNALSDVTSDTDDGRSTTGFAQAANPEMKRLIDAVVDLTHERDRLTTERDEFREECEKYRLNLEKTVSALRAAKEELNQQAANGRPTKAPASSGSPQPLPQSFTLLHLIVVAVMAYIVGSLLASR